MSIVLDLVADYNEVKTCTVAILTEVLLLSFPQCTAMVTAAAGLDSASELVCFCTKVGMT